MKKYVLNLLIILTISSAFGQEWYEDWPTSLPPETAYYRGQRTDLASFKHLLEMLVNPSSQKVITSRMFRTFEKVFPEKSLPELTALADEQRKYWERNNMLGWIADCHADPYMCNLPKIEKLMGVAFEESNLPEDIKKQLLFERGLLETKPDNSKANILEFFDPVVSTSYRKDIAHSFGRDKNGNDGYVLILNDQYHRHCSEKRKETANCFINNEEFMEELEFPMWGYVSSDEFDGFIVDHVTIRKEKNGSIKWSDSQNKKEILLKIDGMMTCGRLKKINAGSPKINRLKSSLAEVFNCVQ